MIRIKRKTTIFLMIMLFAIYTNYAQEDTDFESWSSITLEYKPNKKLTFALEGELRLKNNLSEIDQYFTHLNIDYELFKNFELGVGLRYIRNNDIRGKIQGYENHFRFNLDLSYKHKIGAISFKHRIRYQNKNELGISSSEGDYANQHIRFKSTLTFKIKNWRLDPVFSAEIFNHFEKGEENGFDKYRLAIGTNYKLKKLGKIGLFYRVESALNVMFPKITNIFMLKYTYTIK